MSDSSSWRRGFAAGFMALALSVGGQIATSGSEVSAGESCPLMRSRMADRLADRVTAHVEVSAIAQRVARAVIGAFFNSCS
jgi:hypothetical protein